MSGFRSLDLILRGKATRLPDLMQGEFQVPVVRLSLTITLLATFYGGCMGSSAVLARWDTTTRQMGYEQVMASMIKVPLLFFLTLLVTFPSLYVFNALLGSRLRMLAMLRLLVATLAVMIAVLASFGPISAFFAISTSSHPFMIVLHTAVFTVAGFLGLAFLLRTLQRLTLVETLKEQGEATVSALSSPAAAVLGLPTPSVVPLSTTTTLASPAPTGAGPDPGADELFASAAPRPDAGAGFQPHRAEEFARRIEARYEQPAPRAGALDRISGHTPGRQVTTIFRIWIVVFALVGVQMAWILRPFIGDPAKPFEFFSPRESNFFAGLFEALMKLANGR